MLRFILFITAILFTVVAHTQDTRVDTTVINLSQQGRTYARQGNTLLARQYLQKAIQISLEKLPKDVVTLGKNYNYLAFIYITKIGNLDSAKINLEKTVSLLEDSIQNKNLGYAYKELGNIFHRRAKNDKAKIYLDQALNTYQKIDNKSGAINTLSDIALFYGNTGKIDTARQIFNQILDDSNATPKQKGNAASNFAALLHEKDQTKEALKYIDIAISIFQKAEKKDWLSAAYDAKASILTKQKKWTEAKNYSRKAIALQDTSKVPNRDLGRQLTNLACIYTEQGKFAEALPIHQQSLQAYLADFKPIDDVAHPSSTVLQAASSEPRIIESLQAKAQTFWQQYQQTQQLSSLENALATYMLTVQQIDLVKQELDADQAKTFLHNVFYPVYENALQAALAVYKVKKENKYLEKAFYFSEKNKASILLAAIKKMEAQQNAQIPDSLLQQERRYKQSLAFLQFQKKETGKVAAYNDSIFAYNKQLENVQKEIKKHFPAYTKYHKNIPTSSPSQLQAQLQKEDKKTALIEYFIGDSTIYTFAITATEFIYTTTPKTAAFDENITQLHTFLKVPKTDKDSYQQYTKSAHQLYQTLLTPSLEALPNASEIEKLIIIPDGKLAYIPFEVLLSQSPSDPNAAEKSNKYRLHQLDYLLERYVFTYAPSATLWLESLAKKSDPNAPISSNYIGFCPEFKLSPDSLINKGCTGKALQPLNPKTVTDVCELFGGQAYMKGDAIKDTFHQKSGNSKILHLYTHACISDDDPMQNQIFFTDEPAYNYELYGLKLNADLAVLTACETGTGELIRGEGIMSLSRAFLYAGCPSVITSLWEAHEATTRLITKQFYQNLYNGLPKDAALRQAKLHFLKESKSNLLVHPFHWAAFIHIGNHQAIDFQQNKWWTKCWFWGLLLLLVGVGIFCLWRWSK